MAEKGERRFAPRITVNIPTLVEKIGQREVRLHPLVARVYERVKPDPTDVGKKFPATIRDLSANGAFICGLPLPLLSRVAFTFPLPGFGQVEVLGWTLWRRREDCEVPMEGQADKTLSLKSGFGVIFEAIGIDARVAIARLVDSEVAPQPARD
jgi:hypothetical protein